MGRTYLDRINSKLQLMRTKILMPSTNKHKAIIALSFPIIGGMISQNIVNIVDTAMVGQVGTSALASVGLGSFLNFFCSALVMGLAVGVQTQTARLRGAGKAQYAIPLNGGLSLSTAISLPLCFLLIWQTPNLMALVTDSSAIAQDGSLYLQARLSGMVALGANFAFRSYWSAVEKAHFYLFTLMIMHTCNILINWVLIFGHWGMPAMGVEGAGYGTAISMWIGLSIHIFLALKHAMPFGFLKGLPTRKAWQELLTMSLPSGVERMFFALGMTIFMTLIGWIGDEELAASNIILNLFLVAILPAMGFGIASATFVAKAIGAQKYEELSMWKTAVSQWALVTLTFIGLIFYIFNNDIIMLFTNDTLSNDLASSILYLMVFFLPCEAFHMVTYQSLIGLADNRFVMFLTLSLQWILVLPLIYLIAVHWSWGLIWAWGIHFGGRVIQLICYTLRWRYKLGKQRYLA